MGRPPRGHRLQRAEQVSQYTLDIVHHIGIADVNDLKTQFRKCRVAPNIALRIGMSFAIDLDDQSHRRAEEIRDVMSDHRLTPKLEAAQLRPRQKSP